MNRNLQDGINFFSKLTSLGTGKLWFAEWAAGVNTNPPDDPSSNIDYSYAKVKSVLQNKSISAGWLKRVKAVVHISADECMRFDLNKRRLIPSTAQPEAIEKGTAFWQKDEQVLRFYGKDDFHEIKDLLEAHDIDIHTITPRLPGPFAEASPVPRLRMGSRATPPCPTHGFGRAIA